MSRAEICLAKTDRYRGRDYLEYFIRGLNSHKQNFIVDQGFTTIKEAVERLEQRRVLRASLPTYTTQKRYDIPGNSFSKNLCHFNSQTKKWCKYHKTSGHSDAECRAKRSYNEAVKQPNQFLIQDKIEDLSEIKLSSSYMDKNLSIILDTVSRHSIISEAKATDLGLKIRVKDLSCRKILQNAGKFSTLQKIF
ncbi:hypothetical protein ENBRE01_0076 [Enteropsectra breve]|nr:hypothetical protein ENBRE01_0076 [Enteropsectra breve]